MADPTPLSDDPFFRVLRERHPDADLVVLPPAAPAPDDEPAEVRERARELVATARATLDSVFRRIGREPSVAVDLWSSHDRTGRRRRIARAAVHDLDPGAPVALLREVGDALLALGWDARPYADGSPRLRAVRDGLVCEARAFGQALAVEVTSAPLPLSDATAAELEEAGPWV